MVFQFTLQNLLFYVMYAVGLVAGIILLTILLKIRKVVGVINQDSLKKSIRNMPVIIENVEQISYNLRESTDRLKISVPVILKEVECVSIMLKDSIDLAGDVMGNVGSGINDTIAIYKRDSSDFKTYLHIIEEVWPI